MQDIKLKMKKVILAIIALCSFAIQTVHQTLAIELRDLARFHAADGNVVHSLGMAAPGNGREGYPAFAAASCTEENGLSGGIAAGHCTTHQAEPERIAYIGTMAKLQAMTLQQMESWRHVYLGGYATPNDGGQANYSFLTAVQCAGKKVDGGTVIAPADQAGAIVSGCMFRDPLTPLRPQVFGCLPGVAEDCTAAYALLVAALASNASKVCGEFPNSPSPYIGNLVIKNVTQICIIGAASAIETAKIGPRLMPYDKSLPTIYVGGNFAGQWGIRLEYLHLVGTHTCTYGGIGTTSVGMKIETVGNGVVTDSIFRRMTAECYAKAFEFVKESGAIYNNEYDALYASSTTVCGFSIQSVYSTLNQLWATKVLGGYAADLRLGYAIVNNMTVDGKLYINSGGSKFSRTNMEYDDSFLASPPNPANDPNIPYLSVNGSGNTFDGILIANYPNSLGHYGIAVNASAQQTTLKDVLFYGASSSITYPITFSSGSSGTLQNITGFVSGVRLDRLASPSDFAAWEFYGDVSKYIRTPSWVPTNPEAALTVNSASFSLRPQKSVAFDVTWPTTTNNTQATISGVPYMSGALSQCHLSSNFGSLSGSIAAAGTTIALMNEKTLAAVTNADLADKRVIGTCIIQ